MQHRAPTLDSDQLLTKQDVARKAQYSLRSINYWMETGLLAYVKLGRGVRFIPADVERFIQAHRIGEAK